jgi:hypothetical protein
MGFSTSREALKCARIELGLIPEIGASGDRNAGIWLKCKEIQQFRKHEQYCTDSAAQTL